MVAVQSENSIRFKDFSLTPDLDRNSLIKGYVFGFY